jgi:hypothetical protein
VVLVVGLRSIGLLLAMRTFETLAVVFLVDTEFLLRFECDVAGIARDFCYGLLTTAPWMPKSGFLSFTRALLGRLFLRLEMIPFKKVSIISPVAHKERALLS